MSLADRLAQAMAAHQPRMQRMFGGTGFLVNDNLVIGTMKEGLIVRIGPEAIPAALDDSPHAEQARMGGRVMTGWVMVSPDGCEGADLAIWVDRAMAFNRSLPPAAAKTAKTAKRKT